MEMKRIIACFLAVVMVLAFAGCQHKELSHAELKPYLEDFHNGNKTIEDRFYIPANLPEAYFEIKGTGTTMDGETVDLFAGKELKPGQYVAFENPENLKEIHVEVNEIIKGESYEGIVWDVDVINNRTSVSLGY